MTRSLNSDLRIRVIAAVEEGLSTREAARRFRVGISTVGTWCRRYRESGEMAARKQGQPSRSKLDPHEGFILSLVVEAPDITLAEIAERLAAEHGVRAVPSMIWVLLDRRGITFKKRRRMPASNSAPTSFGSAGHGSKANSISIPNGRSSSTKRRRRPRWRGCAGERGVVNAAAPPSRTDTGKPRPSRPVYGSPASPPRCCWTGR